MEKIEVLDVESTGGMAKKGTNSSSKRPREKKPSTTVGKGKPINFGSTENSGKKGGPRPKRKALGETMESKMRKR